MHTLHCFAARNLQNEAEARCELRPPQTADPATAATHATLGSADLRDENMQMRNHYGYGDAGGFAS